MSIEHLSSGAASQPWTISAEPQPGGPPRWLLFALGAAYLVAFAGLLFAPGGTFIERLRALDGGICAQAATHSFHIAGEQLPLCARNTGIYLGFYCATLVLTGSRRLRAAGLPSLAIMLILGLAVAFMGVDGFNSFFLDLGLPHLYQPQNPLRLASGLGTGVAMAAFIVPTANSLLWRDEDTRASFTSVRQLAVVVPLLALAFLGVTSQAGWLLYPIAILSSIGLVLALTLVNLVLALSVTNRIGAYANWRQVFPAFSLALGLAVIELLALFMLKGYALSVLSAS